MALAGTLPEWLAGRPTIRPIARQGFYSFALETGPLCGLANIRHAFSQDAIQRARAPRLSWLDLAGGRLRLYRLSRNGGRIDFLPLGAPPRAQAALGPRSAHSSRGKKVSRPPSSAALRPASGCVVDRLRPPDRHRGRGGRGLENSKEK
jgi:hypothetical protein